MLIDIVSKNGNLLLNLPLHPDGSLDDEEISFLRAMGRWMKVNGEGIYETRPWVTYGEGPAKGGGGHFNESATHYTSRDFRYTARGDSRLYAFFMDWPEDGSLHLRALARTGDLCGVIDRVELLGHEGALKFKHTDRGLAVTLPDTMPCEHAWALRITGRDLRSFEPGEFVYAVEPTAEGQLVLNADDARIHGNSPRVEKKPTVDRSNIGHWGSADDWVSWQINVPAAGDYHITARLSSLGRSTPFVVELGQHRIEARSIPTSDWAEFATVDMGRIRIDEPGVRNLMFKPRDRETWAPLGLLEIKLVPATDK
jgi:hypothetical protein